MKGRVILGVLGLALLAAGVAAVVAGVSQINTRLSGERTTARVRECVTGGTTKSRSIRCTGTWVAGGRLVGGGGRAVVGSVEGAGDGDVGRRIEVRLSGDGETAYTPSLLTPIVYVAAGLAFGALAVFLLFGVIRRRP